MVQHTNHTKLFEELENPLQTTRTFMETETVGLEEHKITDPSKNNSSLKRTMTQPYMMNKNTCSHKENLLKPFTEITETNEDVDSSDESLDLN